MILNLPGPRRDDVDSVPFAPNEAHAMKISKCIVLAVALLAIPLASAPAPAQQASDGSYARIARDSYNLNKVDAEKLEASLVGTPDDLQARAKLLGFYFGGATRLYGAETTIAHRRRHILWLIEHHPDSEVVGLSEATIDPAGHALADRQGYEQAAKSWIEATQSPRSNAAVLGNAAKFFQLPDKERSAALLNQAQKIAPDDKRWSERLGYVYALAILGVDGLNQNGLPTRHDPAEAAGDFARRARQELERSTDPIMVGIAGRILGQYGLMMGGMFAGTFQVDVVPIAETFLVKAQTLDPTNSFWPRSLGEFHKLRAIAGK